MARIGKIARLPAELREQINLRLLAGEPAAKILPWLNALPEVKTLLEEDFEGLSLNDENLSKWRKGGFQEWLARRDRVATVRELSMLSVKLAEANGGSISEGAAAIAAGQILQVLEKLDDVMRSGVPPAAESPESLPSPPSLMVETLGDLTLALSRLRKGDHNAQTVQLNRERLKQGDATLALERQKFQRTTCELFITWAANQAALALATGPAPNSAKIEELGKMMFGDIWEDSIENPKSKTENSP